MPGNKILLFVGSVLFCVIKYVSEFKNNVDPEVISIRYKFLMHFDLYEF